MIWQLSHRYDPRAVALADRHYSRQKVGTPQFISPGRYVALVADNAVWVSLWPTFAQHEWRGAWTCTIFRNESEQLSSDLIRQAVAASRWAWGDPPEQGMITFINVDAIRHKRDPGRCFRKAGFVPVGWTKERGRLVLQLKPADFPAPEMPAFGQFKLAV